MKIIHCADLHLDSRMNTHLDEKTAKERRQELLQTFQRMVQYADENEVRAILIAGDLFDGEKVQLTTKHVLLDEIKNHPQILFFYLKGNHDEENTLLKAEELPENLKLFDRQWKSYSLGEELCITGMESGDREEERDVYARQLSLSLDQNKVNIVLLHGQVLSYDKADGRNPVFLKLLQNKGIDYLALGHFHSYKRERLDARGVYCYPGCLEGRGFDECGEHGFVLLSFMEQERKLSAQWVPFAMRNLYTCRVDISGCMQSVEIGKRVQQYLQEKKYDQKSLLKIILIGEIDVECEINLDYIQVMLQSEYYFVKVENQTKLHISRERYRGDFSLKGEFVRMVENAPDLSEEDQAAIIRYGLQSLNGEEVGV